jgi:K+-transporting ATPase ATPase C chain
MRKDLISGLVAVVAFTLVLGVAYPLVVTGVSQVAFGNKADGSLVKDGNGMVTGSTLIGQDYSKPVLDGAGKPKKDSDGNPVTEPDPKYFQTRPSATGDDPSATFFSNRPPNSSSARFFYRDGLAAYLTLNGKDNPGLKNADVPVDAVTTSASGVDPDISKANAAIQANRVAAVRAIPVARVKALVDQHTDGRFLGVLGEPGVNVVTLNAALDSETR